MHNCKEQEHVTVFPGLFMFCNIDHIPFQPSIGANTGHWSLMRCAYGGSKGFQDAMLFRSMLDMTTRGQQRSSLTSVFLFIFLGQWFRREAKDGSGERESLAVVGGVCRGWTWKEDICGRRGIAVVILEGGRAWWGFAVKLLGRS